MKKFAKIINEETKAVVVGIGTNESFYRSEGMTETDVEQGFDGAWYVAGFAPVPPAPTLEEQKEKRALAYLAEVDPITAHIQRERDEAEPDEEKIATLIDERANKVAEIKERYPYPEESEDADG